MIKPAPRPHTRAASLPGQEHGQRGPRRAPGRRHRLGVERGDPRSTSPAWLLPRLPVHGPDQPAPHPHTPVGHDDRGVHHRLPQRPRHEGGSLLRHRTRCRREGRSLDRSQMPRGRGGGHREGRAGCVVAPGCGTVAEQGSGVMVLDQPRLGIARS